jgi:hypothetical protein
VRWCAQHRRNGQGNPVNNHCSNASGFATSCGEFLETGNFSVNPRLVKAVAPFRTDDSRREFIGMEDA